MKSWVRAVAVTAMVLSALSMLPAVTSAQELCDKQVATIVGAGVINGTSGNDVIVGSNGNDTINGNGGDDIICGFDGDDTIHGNSGNDRLFGGIGRDTLYGDSGDDYILMGDDGRSTIAHGGTGNDTLVTNGYSMQCEPQITPLVCTSSNHLFGDAGNDTLAGGAVFHGGSGNDNINGIGLLMGDAGDDTLIVPYGYAVLVGGSGNDLLNGRLSALSRLDGGSAQDTCLPGLNDIVLRSCETVG